MQVCVGRDKEEKRPKTSLAILLYDHGIFSEKKVWKNCIKYVIEFKMEEF